MTLLILPTPDLDIYGLLMAFWEGGRKRDF
jgi:hypothetical protein